MPYYSKIWAENANRTLGGVAVIVRAELEPLRICEVVDCFGAALVMDTAWLSGLAEGITETPLVASIDATGSFCWPGFTNVIHSGNFGEDGPWLELELLSLSRLKKKKTP